MGEANTDTTSPGPKWSLFSGRKAPYVGIVTNLYHCGLNCKRPGRSNPSLFFIVYFNYIIDKETKFSNFFDLLFLANLRFL